MRNSLHPHLPPLSMEVHCLVHLVRAALVSHRKMGWVEDNCIKFTLDPDHRCLVLGLMTPLSMQWMGCADPKLSAGF